LEEREGVVKFLRDRISVLELENETLRQDNARLSAAVANAVPFKRLHTAKVDAEVNSSQNPAHGAEVVSGAATGGAVVSTLKEAKEAGLISQEELDDEFGHE
jgi:hypothetical protein